jgi:glucosamine--fructose-6-phosphate aminotransferase (isomerizing)
MTNTVSVVHNGIIENYRSLKQKLTARGHHFETETDTEVVTHLVTDLLQAQQRSPIDAVREAIRDLEGAFALALLFRDEDDLIVAARRGSPLAIGHGSGEMFLGSDALALAPFTNVITYLDDGDLAVLRRSGVTTYDSANRVVERPKLTVKTETLRIEKGGHAHFMAKEIHEQPDVVRNTLARYADIGSSKVTVAPIGLDLSRFDRITISACGTAYYAGLIARYWLERYAGLAVDIDIASEFRYRTPALAKGGLALFISQSGETADTLACLRYCREAEQSILAVVNVANSTIEREADYVLKTYAGPEVGVASTKAFTSQLVTLAALAVAIGRARGILSGAQEAELVDALAAVPAQMRSVLAMETHIADIAQLISNSDNALFLGRGASSALAMEGALKLKEISYIHAEGYAAGELKHGPIALIDEALPVIVLAPNDALFEKTMSNLQEVAARGGRIVLVSDVPVDRTGCTIFRQIEMPSVHPLTAPIVYAASLQLIAYHAALALGRDVDRPRNLAKSVTVE